jgi:hypothetical protein
MMSETCVSTEAPEPIQPLLQGIWDDEDDRRSALLRQAFLLPWEKRDSLNMLKIDEDDPFSLWKLDRVNFYNLILPESEVNNVVVWR